MRTPTRCLCTALLAGALFSCSGPGANQTVQPAADPQACEQGDGQACLKLGEPLYRVQNTPEQLAQARAYFLRGCDHRHARACRMAADAILFGKGGPEDQPRAQRLFEQACDLGDSAGCARYATLLSQSDAPADKQRALALLDKTCKAGEAEACRNLAGFYYIGVGCERDLAKAEAAYRLACDRHKDPEACNALAKLILEASKSPERIAEAIGTWEAGCRIPTDTCKVLMENTAGLFGNVPCSSVKAGMKITAICCTNAGLAWGQGVGGTERPDRAIAMFTLGCDAGDNRACGFAATLLHKSGEIAKQVKARELLTTACERGMPSGCTFLGTMLRDGEGGPVDLDGALWTFDRACALGESGGCGGRLVDDRAALAGAHPERADALRKACEQADANACYRLAALVGTQALPPAEGETFPGLLEKACDEGHMMACFNLAQLVARGKGGAEADDVRARALLTKTCQRLLPEPCYHLAFFTRDGRGGPADAAKANQLFSLSCELGYAQACSAMK